MGRLVGIEPTHIGATIRRVNHFTRAAIFKISPESFGSKAEIFTGEYLSSRGVATQVLSAYECLTAVFGMGTGGTTQPFSPVREFGFPENRTGKSNTRISFKEKPTTY